MACAKLIWQDGAPEDIKKFSKKGTVQDWIDATTTSCHFKDLRAVWKTKSWSSAGISKKQEYVTKLVELVWSDVAATERAQTSTSVP